MKHPIQVKITSGHPIIGKLIVTYKHIIKLLIGPYLRNVFDVVVEEYDELEKRFLKEKYELSESINGRVDVIQRNTDDRVRRGEIRLDEAEMKLHSLENANDRLDTAEHKLDSLYNANDRLDEIERRLFEQSLLNEELIERMDNITITSNREMKETKEMILNDIKTDILRRTDDLFNVSDQRTYFIDERQKKIEEEFEKLKNLEENYRYLSQEIVLQKRRLEIILRELKKSIELDESSKVIITNQKKHIMDHQYFQFENKYRGIAEEIRKRQEIYIPIFDEYSNKNTKSENYVLDIGCGRGEFLELLNEKNIQSKGIDINEDMVFTCKEKGLDVVNIDAISYLEKLKDNSLFGIIALQVVEHLTRDQIVELIKLSHSKIIRGGKVVFESLNPESIHAMKWFYLDMSHHNPVHPKALMNVFETLRFSKTELKYLAPVPEYIKIPINGDQKIEQINEVLFADQEYAVIATK